MESTQSWIIPCLRIMEGLFEVCGRCLSLDPPSLPRRENREFSPVTYFCSIHTSAILLPGKFQIPTAILCFLISTLQGWLLPDLPCIDLPWSYLYDHIYLCLSGLNLLARRILADSIFWWDSWFIFYLHGDRSGFFFSRKTKNIVIMCS